MASKIREKIKKPISEDLPRYKNYKYRFQKDMRGMLLPICVFTYMFFKKDFILEIFVIFALSLIILIINAIYNFIKWMNM